jgi:hypothetical protein
LNFLFFLIQVKRTAADAKRRCLSQYYTRKNRSKKERAGWGMREVCGNGGSLTGAIAVQAGKAITEAGSRRWNEAGRYFCINGNARIPAWKCSIQPLRRRSQEQRPEQFQKNARDAAGQR